jgi:hypothetical protein
VSVLAGITKDACATACNIGGCEIAGGRPHCMHPLKGGVPHEHKSDPAILESYAQACTVLGVKNVNQPAEGIVT